MLISADVKGLEVVACAFLSQDEALCEEVRNGVDIHEVNKQRFGLPDRLTAKRFKFKLIYGASAFGYANDPDFFEVSRDTEFWQKVIDEYYIKYRGVYRWHDTLVQCAINDGKYTSPFGREYRYRSDDVVRRPYFWRPKILNYPVQGLGADLVMIARISAFRRLRDSGAIPVTSVHDSIVFDSPPEIWYNTGLVIKKSVEDVPENVRRIFGVDFNLPLTAEVKYGHNLGEMTVADYN